MELRVLKYFLTVAREESITKAAEALYITQPTLLQSCAGLAVCGQKRITGIDAVGGWLAELDLNLIR